MFGNQNANLKLFGLNWESFWLKAVKPSFLSLSMDNTHLLCIVLFLLSITHQGYCVLCNVWTLLEFLYMLSNVYPAIYDIDSSILNIYVLLFSCQQNKLTIRKDQAFLNV